MTDHDKNYWRKRVSINLRYEEMLMVLAFDCHNKGVPIISAESRGILENIVEAIPRFIGAVTQPSCEVNTVSYFQEKRHNKSELFFIKERKSRLLYAIDEFEIYGSDVVSLHNLCGRDIEKTATVFYAMMFGLVQPKFVRDSVKHFQKTSEGLLEADSIVSDVLAVFPHYQIDHYQPVARRPLAQASVFRHRPK